jgi:hypothetical protein
MTDLNTDNSYTASFNNPITAYRAVSTVVVNSPANDSPITWTTWNPSATDNTTILASGTIFMDPLIVYWQEKDLSAFDIEYASELAQRLDIPTPARSVVAVTVTATTPAPTSATKPTSAAGSIDTPTAVGLSAGAKPGISIGVAAGVILLTVAGFLLYKKKQRQKTKLTRETLSQNEQPELVQTRAPEATA